MIKKKQLREKLQDRSAAQRGDGSKAAVPLTAPSAAATENNAYNDHHRYGGGNSQTVSQSVGRSVSRSTSNIGSL